MGELLSYPKFKAHSDTGVALSGGKLYTYASGTTTPKATYSDAALTTPNANPVILDAEGEAAVWLDGEYYLELYDSGDVQQWTIDEVGGFAVGLTATAAELNYNDITTLGTSEDSKVVTQAADGTIVIGVTAGNETMDIASHDLVDGGLKLAGTLVTASATELNQFDGAILKMIRMYISDNGAGCDVVTTSLFNGDAISSEGPLSKSGSTTSFTLNAGGTELAIKATALTDDAVAALATIDVIDDGGANGCSVMATVDTGAIELIFSDTLGAALDITSVVDNDTIVLSIFYITES